MTEQAGKWIKIALFNFLVAASIGLLLRYAFVNEVKWLNYKKFQDAHSNLALMGWSFQGLFACLVACFLPSSGELQKRYNRIFIRNQVLISIVVINYIADGPKVVSNILFIALASSIFLFARSFFKDGNTEDNRNSIAFPIAKTALIFFLLSFLGLFSVIPILISPAVKKIIFYYLGIQFFLHFQYNAWFTFAAFSLLFRFAENQKIKFNKKRASRFKWLMTGGVLLTYFLSVYWGFRNKQIFLWVASAGALLQLYAVISVRDKLQRAVSIMYQNIDPLIRPLLWISAGSFILKLMMQTATVIPAVASIAFTIRNFVIAYLHMIFIGFLTMFLIAWAYHHRYIRFGKVATAGIVALVLGFVSMEVILFLQGTLIIARKGFLEYYYHLIFLVTILLPLGLFFIIVSNKKPAYY